MEECSEMICKSADHLKYCQIVKFSLHVYSQTSPEVRHVSECIKSPVQSLHHRTL